MKTRPLSLIVTLIVLFAAGGFFLINRPDETVQPLRSNEPIPYIYYYSDLEHAFVIERADGTDSRLLAQGVMPDNHNVIDSVHWSPSGEYLAWRSRPYGGSIGSFSTSGWLVSTDGSYISQHLVDAEEVFFMEWSPNRDLLMIAFTETSQNELRLRVIDVPDDSILVSMDFNSVVEPDTFRDLDTVWSDDSSTIYFPFRSTIINHLIRINLDGTSRHWLFYEDYSGYSSTDFAGEHLIDLEIGYNSGAYQYEWIITDLTTGDEQVYDKFQITERQSLSYELSWNPDRSIAIIREYMCAIQVSRFCDLSRLALFYWEDGERYILPEHLNYESWSADGVLLLLKDESGYLHLFDTETRQISPVEVNNVERWQWFGEHDLFIITSNDADQPLAYHYNWATHAAIELTDVSPYINSDFRTVTISPNDTFLGYVGGQDIHIYNFETDEHFLYPRASYHTTNTRADYFPIAMGYDWNEDERWFFSRSNRNAFMIHHIDAPIGRELTLCFLKCAGFVPDEVLPYLIEGQPTSYLSEPSTIILHDANVTGIAWNSDGTLLATYSTRNATENIINVWNMSNTEPTLVHEWQTEIRCSEYRIGCAMTWADVETLTISGIERFGYENTSFNIRTGDISALQADAAFINNYEFEWSDEQSYLIDTEIQERISDNPLQNFTFTIIPDTAYNYNSNTSLLIISDINSIYRGRLWDVSSGNYLGELNWMGYMAQFNPGGTQLAVASSRFVSIWDMTPYIEQVQGN